MPAQVGNARLRKADERSPRSTPPASEGLPGGRHRRQVPREPRQPSQRGRGGLRRARDLREQPGEADRRVRDLEAKLGTNLSGSKACLNDGAGRAARRATPATPASRASSTTPTSSRCRSTCSTSSGTRSTSCSSAPPTAAEGGGECGHYSAGPDYGRAAEYAGPATDDGCRDRRCTARRSSGTRSPASTSRSTSPVTTTRSAPTASRAARPLQPGHLHQRRLREGRRRPNLGGAEADPERERDERKELEKELARTSSACRPAVKLPPQLEDGLGLGPTDEAAANDLLDFLFAP